MKILIPARGGSKRIPNKNLQKIGNKTLLQITVEHAIKLGGTPIVSSDSDVILGLAGILGVQTIYRKPEWATDTAPTLPIWKDFADKVDGDYVGLMQCTSPYRNLVTLKEDLDTMQSKGIESGFSAVIFGGFVHTLRDGRVERCFPRVRTQEIPTKFVIEDGSFYVANRKALLEADDLFFGNPYILRNDLVLDIDNLEDLELARKIWNAKNL